MEQSTNGGTGSGGSGGGSEDAGAAREHVRNAEENRDALEAQSRRTEATAPGADRPIEGSRAAHAGGPSTSGGRTSGGDRSDPGARRPDGGMSAGGAGGASEDTSAAEANVREAERNRDALAAQNRRVESTTPDGRNG